jgi:SAM-dependent methyltransferase
MAPAIVLGELASEQRLRVLDPMAGSGTVLAMAARAGHEAVGGDLDPLAVLIARVWCSRPDGHRARRIAKVVLTAAQRTFVGLPARAAMPSDDPETRTFVSYWFDTQNRRQLASLARAIAARRDPVVRDLLWCAFSRMIIAKTATVSLAADVPHSRPHRVRDRAEYLAFDRFLPSVEVVLRALTSSPHRGGTADVKVGDARNLPNDDESIDRVVTSPPYLNAIDYMRTSRFSLVWMGHDLPSLRAIRAASIGTEVGLRDEREDLDRIARVMLGGRVALPSAEQGMVRRFVDDMDKAIGQTARVLVRGGRATYVVGNSTIRGIFVRNSECVATLARAHGLRLISKRERRLPDNLRYLPPPSQRGEGLELRMRTEVIVRLEKPA